MEILLTHIRLTCFLLLSKVHSKCPNGTESTGQLEADVNEKGFYLSNKNYTWNKCTLPGHYFVIEFKHFDLDRMWYGKCEDVLKITDQNKVIFRRCGYQRNPMLRSNSNQIKIEFITDDVQSNRTGFKFCWNSKRTISIDKELTKVTTTPVFQNRHTFSKESSTHGIGQKSAVTERGNNNSIKTTENSKNEDTIISSSFQLSVDMPITLNKNLRTAIRSTSRDAVPETHSTLPSIIKTWTLNAYAYGDQNTSSKNDDVQSNKTGFRWNSIRTISTDKEPTKVRATPSFLKRHVTSRESSTHDLRGKNTVSETGNNDSFNATERSTNEDKIKSSSPQLSRITTKTDGEEGTDLASYLLMMTMATKAANFSSTSRAATSIIMQDSEGKFGKTASTNMSFHTHITATIRMNTTDLKAISKKVTIHSTVHNVTTNALRIEYGNEQQTWYIIAGIVVAGILIETIIVSVACTFCKRRQKRWTVKTLSRMKDASDVPSTWWKRPHSVTLSYNDRLSMGNLYHEINVHEMISFQNDTATIKNTEINSCPYEEPIRSDGEYDHIGVHREKRRSILDKTNVYDEFKKISSVFKNH